MVSGNVFPTNSESQTQYHHVSHEIKLHMPRYKKPDLAMLKDWSSPDANTTKKVAPCLTHIVIVQSCAKVEIQKLAIGKIAINHHFQRVTFWLFNIAMEIPYKWKYWKFIAGKIIDKWGIVHSYAKWPEVYNLFGLQTHASYGFIKPCIIASAKRLGVPHASFAGLTKVGLYENWM